MMTNWFGISNTAPEGVIPDSVKFAFYFGAVAFFAAVAWTVFSTKEYSPDQLKKFEETEEEEKKQKAGFGGDSHLRVRVIRTPQEKPEKMGIGLTATGLLTTALVYFMNYMADLYVLTVGVLVFGVLELLALLMQKTAKSKAGPGRNCQRL
ncbi:MAG: hypothetical protein U5L09_00165 [Bacteroidales bacterium]|nr:hypothetical protein [Bacteroidales bacterium]